jgi:predicted short-subunit dehydrogenase-like oxidoreductase (DUF2520 family)
MDRYNISFAGAGRVGGALCEELFSSGFRIDLIVSPSENRGKPLAAACLAKWSSELVFPDSTEILIVSVPDHRIAEVLTGIKCSPDTLVVHTSGATSIDIFPDSIKHKGVFYPLQTFSNDRKVNFKNLPFLIEASDDSSAAILENLALCTGGKVFHVDSDHRRMLHLAAVFACNFSNFMFTTGKSIAEKAGFDFDILVPLIDETVSKALSDGPENSQTGPAMRNDVNTIENHLELLSFAPELKTIYKEISQSISQYYKK